jgi:hypothetical protein
MTPSAGSASPATTALEYGVIAAGISVASIRRERMKLAAAWRG